MSFLTIAIVTTLLSALSSEARLPVSLDLDPVRAIPVQHDGRLPPLDTLARDTVESITGRAFYQGRDPVLWLLAWTFDPQTWQQVPLISIPNVEVRTKLMLPGSREVFSYEELVSEKTQRSLEACSSGIGVGTKMDPIQAKFNDLQKKLLLLARVFHGQMIRLVPDPDAPIGEWRPIAAAKQDAPIESSSVQDAWVTLKKAFLTDDGFGFASASQRLTTALAALPAAYRPEPRLIATELRYNRLKFFRTAWMVMAVGVLLAAIALWVRRQWYDALVVLVSLAGFGILTYGLWLRWQIAGRIPAANMFESLLFLSWGTGAFSILGMISLRNRIVPLNALAIGALALVLADCLPIDAYIRPIPPVLLDTVWMSIHVPVMMVSYSVLSLAALLAHVQLIGMAIAPARRAWANAIDVLHCRYIQIGSLLLAAGIITGSMWAASSWGRYWGWDPKEVWSLVALLGYLAILHVRLERKKVSLTSCGLAIVSTAALLIILATKFAPLSGKTGLVLTVAGIYILVFVLMRGVFATAIKSIFAFWLIIMTYIGVNYVLGAGLHSYGFGTGTVIHHLSRIAGLELVLIVVCSITYLARQGTTRAKATI